MAEPKFKIIGKTEDGKTVIAGVFRMYDTCGLPLPDLFIQCEKHGLMPSSMHFVSDALTAGWKPNTVRSRLEEAIFECYGLEFKERWKVKFDSIFSKETS